jgi:crotonobetainyl-CoA:carnitine CoA-transferase CaiB-like acyl-CoA transferase
LHHGADVEHEERRADRPVASRALDRFVVLDLTRVRAGPTAARQLADWGTDVISIEAPRELQQRDPLGGPRHDPDFQNLHRNKRSITLNLKRPEGLEIFKSLVAEADVVLENFRPDVKRRLGIDYVSLQPINPRLVYASISGFGQDGPYRDRPGFDQIAQGMGGLMSITGQPGEGPMRVGIPIADLCAGILCAYGVVVALLERETSGKGQWLHTSLLQAQAFMLDFQAARWLMAGDVPTQEGNNHPTMTPTGVFRTSDGYINIAVVGQQIWERFCEALQTPEWLADPRFATNRLRRENREALHREIDAILENGDSATWVDMLNAQGVPCGPVYSIDQVFDDPQMKALGMVQDLPTGRERRSYLGQPISMTRTPSRLVQHAPELGQHTDEILRAFGYVPSELERLRKEAII